MGVLFADPFHLLIVLPIKLVSLLRSNILCVLRRRGRRTLLLLPNLSWLVKMERT